jgi:hypothetical protein
MHFAAIMQTTAIMHITAVEQGAPHIAAKCMIAGKCMISVSGGKGRGRGGVEGAGLRGAWNYVTMVV